MPVVDMNDGGGKIVKGQLVITGTECQDCGEHFIGYPGVLDFDHVRGEKAFVLGDSSGRNIGSVIAEVEKCDVVCSNCHRIRTARRRPPLCQ
jgi:hypothetical protein